MDLQKSLEEISKFKPILEQYGEKTTQALRIREKLIDEKLSIWQAYENGTLSPAIKKELLFRLKRCLKNEKNFVEIIDTNLKGQLEAFKEVKRRLKELGASKEIMRNLQLIIDIMEYSFDNLENVKKRIENEDWLLSQKNDWFPPIYEEYQKLWKKEITFDRKIARMVTPGSFKRTKAFCDKVDLVLHNLSKEGLQYSGIAAFVGTFFTIPAWGKLVEMDGTALLVLGLTAVAGVLAVGQAMALTSADFENKILKKQEEHLKNVKGYGLFSFAH